MASFSFEVVQDCDFAGIPLTKGMVIVVRPGHATRPITVQQDLPPNYGMLLNLMADEAITERDAFAPLRAAESARPLVPQPRRRHLRLVR